MIPLRVLNQPINKRKENIFSSDGFQRLITLFKVLSGNGAHMPKSGAPLFFLKSIEENSRKNNSKNDTLLCCIWYNGILIYTLTLEILKINVNILVVSNGLSTVSNYAILPTSFLQPT